MYWRASDWKYRAEGGRHIVVYNAQLGKKAEICIYDVIKFFYYVIIAFFKGKVLRITKATRGTSVLPENERAEIEKRLAYENDVIVSYNSKNKKTHFRAQFYQNWM